ncbi:Asp-tRNA(Asn)/Glu-tRNA(Gln) amidotransferase subunit GatC [bacterium]|nr:Asp-tRNA(Asn)/Glu-tRNA(Gln) amidotransferase subunit GatC [bacterium]
MISQDEVQHIAKLARIALSSDEVKKMQKDLSQILDYFEMLKRADISKVKGSNIVKVGENTWREDIVAEQSPGVIREIREASPKKEGDYIKVKLVLEH